MGLEELHGMHRSQAAGIWDHRFSDMGSFFSIVPDPVNNPALRIEVTADNCLHAHAKLLDAALLRHSDVIRYFDLFLFCSCFLLMIVVVCVTYICAPIKDSGALVEG